MQTSQDKIESLHQQAAARYLQGEFEQALEFWQELLSLDTDDERALEGVRLCEMLAEDGDLLRAEEATAPVQSQSSIPIEVTPAESLPPTAVDEDDDLSSGLAMLDLSGSADASPPPLQATVPTPPLVVEESILGDLPDLDTFDPGADDGLDGLDAVLDVTPGGSAAAGELRARVDDLVRQATGAFEAGDCETATNVLSRVFILDETHEIALSLQQTIEAEAATDSAGQLDDLDLDLGLDLDLDLDIEGTEELLPEAIVEEIAPLPPLLDELIPDATPDPADIPMQGLEESDLSIIAKSIPPGVLEAQKQAAIADPGVQRGVGFLSRKFLLIYAVALAVILAGGWGALQFIGRSSSDPVGDQAVAEKQALQRDPVGPQSQDTAQGSKGTNDAKSKNDARGTKNDSGSNGKQQSQDDGAPVAAAVALPPGDLSEVLARAQAAFEAGEFSQAIIAFNQALHIDPTHRLAKAGLVTAGERYRDERASDAKMDAAAAAWNRGDYTAALRVFYRVVDAAEDPRLTRYKQNGWYNLGVQSLHQGKCGEARSHFEELAALVPDDAEAQRLLELTKTCPFSRNDLEYQQQLAELELRQLDD